jgi:hypothetical protein
MVLVGIAKVPCLGGWRSCCCCISSLVFLMDTLNRFYQLCLHIHIYLWNCFQILFAVVTYWAYWLDSVCRPGGAICKMRDVQAATQTGWYWCTLTYLSCTPWLNRRNWFHNPSTDYCDNRCSKIPYQDRSRRRSWVKWCLMRRLAM